MAESTFSPSSGPVTSAYHRRRQHVIALLTSGARPSEIVQQTGYSARTVRHIARQYRTIGIAARVDGRQRTQASRQLLSHADERDLRIALLQPPAEGKCWNGPRVASWIAARTGQRVSRQRGWEYLCRLSLSGAP